MLRECNNCIGAKMLGDAITIRKQKCLDMQDYLKSKKCSQSTMATREQKYSKGVMTAKECSD